MPAATEAIDDEAAAVETANAALGIDIGQLQVSALILLIANCRLIYWYLIVLAAKICLLGKL